MVNESVKLAITSLQNITRDEVRPDGNCVVSAEQLNLVLETVAKGKDPKKENEGLEGLNDWALCFGVDHFEGVPETLVQHINMLVDTSYDQDSMPSFVLCEKELDGARFELRAWVGFDEDDIEKAEFVFDLGLNINDVYQFEYSSQISCLFDEVDSRIQVNSSNAEKKYDKVIELIQSTQNNVFPEKLEKFIIKNALSSCQ